MAVVEPPTFDKIKYRLNNKRPTPKRYPTGIPTLDAWTGGGLPYGLTVFYGGAGSGKTLMARTIALNSEACLYVCSEVLFDAPDPEVHKNIITVNYCTYKPNYKKALQELEILIKKLEPKLVVIDSLTSFLSETNKALEESDLRTGISDIHSEYDGKVPIIGISEIRGAGQYRSTAGGEGVKHKNSLLCEFDHMIIKYPSDAEAYGLNIGDDIYLFRAEKDKYGMTKRDLGRVYYNDGKIDIRIARGSIGFQPQQKVEQPKKSNAWNKSV